MSGKIRFKKGLQILMVAGALVMIIGFTETKQSGEVCKDIVISIGNQHENYFLDEQDVITLMTARGETVIRGSSFKDLNLKAIEQRLKDEKYVEEAEIFKDLKGNILVNAVLRRPFARIINGKGPDAYIAEDGTLLATSDKFNSRVVLVSGDYTGKLLKGDLTLNEEGLKIYELIKFINADKFWKAQIAQIDIDRNLNIILYPQVTKQLIEFGKPEQLEMKFKKLEIFYKQILPQKGWNHYSRVNLEYNNQIIAE